MRRLVMLAALLALALTGTAGLAQSSFSIDGQLGATEQEAQEGYFAVDDATMIVVKPDSELHAYLRARLGQRVRITIEPARQTE